MCWKGSFMNVYKHLRNQRETSKITTEQIQNQFRTTSANTEFSQLNDQNKLKFLNNYQQLLKQKDHYETLLYKYGVAVRKDEKELIKKIAARVGLSIPPTHID